MIMSKPASPVRLLLVGGDDAARTELRRRFVRLGYESMDTADPAKALSLVGMIPFDVVLMDVEAPGLDGLDLLQRMRESRKPSELPIIMIAGEDAREDALEALRLGANDCIVRPIDIETAYARTEMQIRRRRAEDQERITTSELQVRLMKLKEAVVHAENTWALLPKLGLEVRAPLARLVRASEVLTKICLTPELKPAVDTVETAAASIEEMLVRALEKERRKRNPLAKVRVLSADDDARSRYAMRNLLHAAETEVELVDVSTGLQAALAVETHFFDLILVNVATEEAVAGIRAIRRTERQNKTRRHPILAIGPEGQAASEALTAGADLHLAQPVTAERLLSALAGAICRESEDLSAVA
jgi:PleD family two-component response regulator